MLWGFIVGSSLVKGTNLPRLLLPIGLLDWAGISSWCFPWREMSLISIFFLCTCPSFYSSWGPLLHVYSDSVVSCSFSHTSRWISKHSKNSASGFLQPLFVLLFIELLHFPATRQTNATLVHALTIFGMRCHQHCRMPLHILAALPKGLVFHVLHGLVPHRHRASIHVRICPIYFHLQNHDSTNLETEFKSGEKWWKKIKKVAWPFKFYFLKTSPKASSLRRRRIDAQLCFQFPPENQHILIPSTFWHLGPSNSNMSTNTSWGISRLLLFQEFQGIISTSIVD